MKEMDMAKKKRYFKLGKIYFIENTTIMRRILYRVQNFISELLMMVTMGSSII